MRSERAQPDPDILRNLFEAAPSAMVLVGEDGRIALLNQQAEALFGYRRDELVGQPVELLLPARFQGPHPRQRAAYLAAPSARAMGAGRELFGRRKDGSEVPLEIGLNPITSPAGRFVLAAIIDISQRRQLEEGLRQSEERLRTVVEAAPNAMIMVGSDGRIQLVNGEAERMFGYPRHELLGQPIELLVPERAAAGHPPLRQGYLQAPTARAMGSGRELHGRRKDGSEVPLEIGLNPIDTPHGTFVLAAVIDITGRKRHEDLLRASLAEKETLLREIHHRVKNNMQVVSSMLSLQASYVDQPLYRAMFEQCEARVRAMALIHEKLYGADNLGTIDFGQYIRELAPMLVASYAAGAPVRLELQTEPVALDIQAAIPLGLILNELVTNAVKHAYADSGGSLRIALLRAGDDCWLEVQDDGRGLPADLDPQRPRGLGLRMIRGLLRQLEGSCEQLHGAAAGAWFRVSFRLARQPA